ncbi:MAG: hypothetical protein FWB80_11000 [Defluviitaleaceae bacterium]|nr:hypothetical protein [Defluviitaleaceae bacterium]
MKKFKLLTDKYENALLMFLKKANDASVIKSWERFEFYIIQADEFSEMLLGLLLEVTESENPMYKHSARLREMAKNIKSTPLYGRELRLLKKYVAANKELHMEGYVTFRMEELKGKLDMMVYSLVKKIKFGGKD